MNDRLLDHGPRLGLRQRFGNGRILTAARQLDFSVVGSAVTGVVEGSEGRTDLIVVPVDLTDVLPTVQPTVLLQ